MNAECFSELVDIHADAMFRFAHSLLKDEGAAEDAVQDAFEGLWKLRLSVQADKCKSYLYRSVHNRCMDMLRKSRPLLELDVPESNTPVPAAPASVDHDVKKHLQVALSTLPQQQRAMIMLRDFEGYSYAEIADITSSTLDNVKVSLFRARKSLRAYLGSIESLLG